MCSRPRRTFAPLIVALALGLPLAFGCGHKENPKPPPQKIPDLIRDLRVSQRGDKLMISFTYPQVTISGLPIDDIVAIEIWEYETAVPDFVLGEGDDEEGDEAEGEGGEDEAGEKEGETGEGESDEADGAEEASDEAEAPAAGPEAPEETDVGADDEEAESDDETGTADEDADEGDGDEGAADDEADDDEDDRPAMVVAAKETLLEIDPREFAAASQLRMTLQGDLLSNAIRGSKVELTLELGEIEPGEKTALVYGVKSFQSLNRASRFSNLAKIIPRIAPPPPALELEPVANGVKLVWEPEEDEPIEYRFYRRDPLASEFGEFFGSRDGDGDQFLDSTAEAGKSYVYAMTRVAHLSPLVESELSAPAEIEYLDIFPPEPPSDLVVLTETGTARLLWDGSSDPDVAGYVVYRRTGAGDYRPLQEKPVRQTEFSDTSAESGRTYAYRIVAVDRKGNMSEPSEEVEVRIP